MILTLATLAMAQVSSVSAPDFGLEDCRFRPIQGTVGFKIAKDAIKTNANAYSAARFAEKTLMKGLPFAIDIHNVYNVTRVPTIGVCPTELQYGMAGMDVYASSGGFIIPFKFNNDEAVFKLLYAGSVVGSVTQYPTYSALNNRYFSTYGYAFSAVGMAYASPFAPLLSSEDGLRTAQGDFIVGASLALPNRPEYGELTAGYLYSQGLYSNITARKLGLFGTAMLTNKFGLLSLAEAGIRHLPLDALDERWTKVGTPSAFTRSRVFESPALAAFEEQQSAKEKREQGLTLGLNTVHLRQDAIAGVLDVNLAVAYRPDVFLHDLSLTGHIPAGEDSILPSIASAELGLVEFPTMPWYGLEGGRRLYFEVSLAGLVQIRRNMPETLAIFPYAYDATEFHIGIDLNTWGPKLQQTLADL